MIRSYLLAAVAALVLAATVAVAPTVKADGVECPTPVGSSITFAYTGSVEHVAVPAGVDRVFVEARGAHGGQYDTTAPGGVGGLVTATVAVEHDQCLSIYVGREGRHDGGWGYGKGGDEGGTPSLPPPIEGHGGAGGGGGSAVAIGSAPLVVAGGGAGGGGDSSQRGYFGGAGGAGAGGDGTDTPRGEDGFSPRYGEELNFGGKGGWGGDGPNGGDGGSAYWQIIGGGGGGGGGYKGGDGGSAWFENPEEGEDLPYGGGGGGGGSSFAIPGATGVRFNRAATRCRPDHSEPGCDGLVTLSWVQEPGDVEAAGGEQQSATISEPFSLPLRARVTSQSGEPVPGATVTFQLPDSGPSGSFPDGSRTATAITGGDGIAAAPTITAGPAAGRWIATAGVAGVSRPARFELEDLAARTATGLALSPAAPSDGAPTELVARVATQPAAAGRATGEVLFRVDGQRIGETVTLDGAAVARLPGVELNAGSHTVTAAYGGDQNHAPSATSLKVQVAAAGSAVRLSSAENPSAAGEAVTFSGSVTALPPTSRHPGGEVQLLVDGTETATAPLAADGTVSWPAVTLGSEGEHQVEARYLGDGHFAAAGATLVQAVGADASAVTVTPAAPYATYGAPLSWVVQVSSRLSGTPSGSVAVEADGEPICALPLAGGEAVCSPAAALAPGTHAITAAYSGDGPHAAAHGSAEQAVAAAPSTVAAEVVPETTVFGAAWRLHADVTASGSAASPPTGAVRFTIDGAAVGEPVPLGADGATLAGLPSPGAGAHVVAAEYSGDGRFLPGRAIATAQVSPALAEVSLSSSEPSAPAGTGVGFRAAVAAVPSGPVPAGAVRFLVDGRQRGGAVPLHDGVASLPALAELAVGEHRIDAEYLGDGDYRPALGTITQRVTAPAAAGDSGDKRSSPGGPSAAGDRSRRCGTGVTITSLRRKGRLLSLAGFTEPRLEGRRVAIRLGQRRVATTTVRASGRFRASFPLPRGAHHRGGRYRAVVAGIRSAPVRPRGGVQPRAGGCNRHGR